MHRSAALYITYTEDSIKLIGRTSANLSHYEQHKSVLVHKNYRRQISRIFNYILSYS